MFEHIFKNLLTWLKGLVLSPGDKEIFSWWGGAWNIYLLFFADDDLVENLWNIYLKSFNFTGLEDSQGAQKNFSWWGLAIQLIRNLWKLYSRNLWKLYSKYFNFLEKFSGFTRRPGDFLLVGWGLGYLCFRIYFHKRLTLEPLDGFSCFKKQNWSELNFQMN